MAKKLGEYNKKRDFEKTPEPEGKAENSEGSLSFVVQHHLARRDHYDLRLEWDGALLSWAVPKGPSYNPRDKRLAVRVEDHPLDYKNFEGTIPKGEYGGGTVMLWDEGTWEPLTHVETGVREGSLKFTLDGRRLKGKWALIRMKEKENAAGDNWLLVKERDSFTKDDDGVSMYSNSIRTGRTMEEISEGENEKITKNPFDKVDVQLATLVKEVPRGEDWLFELKYDGYRMTAFLEGSRARLLSRNNNDYTDRFCSITSSLLDLAKGRAIVFDGEMTVTDESGRTDFQALQNYKGNPKGKKLTYIIFDLLALDGEDLRRLPLIRRKNNLKELMENAPSNLHFSRHVINRGEESLSAACKLGLEGIVGKKVNSPYLGRRNGDWIKLKCGKRQEFVIGGFTQTEKREKGISSLLLGIYEGNELIYAGRAGSGFSENENRDLRKKFDPIARVQSPFSEAPKTNTNEKVTWLEPLLVAEIKFAQWTNENLLRQASFKGMRTDKNPMDIKRERAREDTPESTEETEKKMEKGSIIVQGVKISNPDKIIFKEPQITKADIVRYYARVSERMLPYISHRIMSVVRCPKGISEACFFKKHPNPGSKGISTISIQSDDGETKECFYIEDEFGLLNEAQMGTVEFHVWGSKAEQIEKPDIMVFDLDPDVGMDLGTVRQGVKDLKEILSELSLVSFLKTSGGKGYHIIVPLKPSDSWEVFHDFAGRVAQVMQRKWPEKYTNNLRKHKRTNKIFIDWLRNGKGATSIAPYSIRARQGAKVSMPISWDELETIAPDGIDMTEALGRISGEDPWKGFFSVTQGLK